MDNKEWQASAQQVLEDNILRFWQERMVDNERGGFYGRIDGHNLLHRYAEKGAVLNARILWSFSTARHLDFASRAKDYLLEYFLDRVYGGVYWSLNADGTPSDTKKQTYAIAFAIYGLSEYYLATGDKEALQTALHLFEDIERHAYDAVNKGYIEALTRDWQPIADMRLSDKDENGALTMNTHLHVLEAYTTLYKACHMSAVEKQLRGLIDIFVERLYNPLTGHIDLFFDEHWHGKRNIASYGHDIEASWLLTEAADVLGDGELKERLLPIIRHIAQASIEGIQTDGSMIHERKDGRDDKERQWWVMCEQVIGFLNQWQLFGDETDRQRAEAAYQYILTNLIDTADGEWYWAIHADGTIDRDNDKAGFWKCPYHNSRMCLNIMDRTLRTDSQCRS